MQRQGAGGGWLLPRGYRSRWLSPERCECQLHATVLEETIAKKGRCWQRIRRYVLVRSSPGCWEGAGCCCHGELGLVSMPGRHPPWRGHPTGVLVVPSSRCWWQGPCRRAACPQAVSPRCCRPGPPPQKGSRRPGGCPKPHRAVTARVPGRCGGSPASAGGAGDPGEARGYEPGPSGGWGGGLSWLSSSA